MLLPECVINIIGWIPGIIFSGASAVQLYAVICSPNVQSVSATTWLLFALANVSAYIYLGKYLAPQAIGYIVAALIQTSVAYVVIKKRRLQ